MSRYVSADGLCSSADPNAVALWDAIGARQKADGRTWVARLRAMGVKAAHPDDGWVHRDRTPPDVTFSYPAFDDKPQVGDLIALGASYHYGEFDGDPKHKRGWWRYRLVEVTNVRHSGTLIPMTYYEFTDTGRRLTDHGEQPARRKRWWQR